MSAVTKSYTVGPIEIHFPGAANPDFSFTHDLAELFGLQSNMEAERRLRVALTSRAKLSIDHEADYVFVFTRNVDAMLAALRGVRAASARTDLFDDAALDQAAKEMKAWRRPEPVVYEPGSLIQVPLEGGSLGAAQIIPIPDRQLFLLFDILATSASELAAAFSDRRTRPVACACFDDTAVVTGAWPLVDKGPLHWEGVHLDALAKRESATIHSYNLAGEFIEAYFGRRPWDPRWDPRRYELILLPGVPPPSTRRYLRDFFEAKVGRLGLAAARVADGPASLHVMLAYRGNALRRLIDLPKARQLAERLLRDVPGAEVVQWGGGGGVFDLFVDTSDARMALNACASAAKELRLERDLVVEAYPPTGFAREMA